MLSFRTLMAAACAAAVLLSPVHSVEAVSPRLQRLTAERTRLVLTEDGVGRVNTTAKASVSDPRGNCFPFAGTLDKGLVPPSVPRNQWWCGSEAEYGFLGFSYPMEDDDCSGGDNSQQQLINDFTEMRDRLGAKYVRVYYPTCTDAGLVQRLLLAGVATNMAVIPQVWFNFGNDNGGNIWHASRDAIVSVFQSSQFGPIAPYVFHSVDFGSEPIGDGVDNGNDQFVSDLADFKRTINSFGVPAGFSDDWDRQALMNGDSFTDLGKRALASSDYIHMHPLPFYNMNNAGEDQAWGYITGQLQRMRRVAGNDIPIMVTESPWAWGPTDHWNGHVDTDEGHFSNYWNTFNDNCEMFKSMKIGWFMHAFYGENTFDMKRDDGSYIVSNWYGKQC